MLNLQMGQVADRLRSHLSMHTLWKKCMQGMVRTSSSFSYSTRHTRHLMLPSSTTSAVVSLASSVSVIFLIGKVSTTAFGVALELELLEKCVWKSSLACCEYLLLLPPPELKKTSVEGYYECCLLSTCLNTS